MNYTVFTTKLCDIVLAGDEQGLACVQLDTGQASDPFAIQDHWQRNDTFFADAVDQILSYFAGYRTSFDIPLNPQGTDFQKKVWGELARIPYGETRSYGDVAAALGKPSASRAVGAANGKNPLPLIVPCHRVIASNGSLAGYALGVETKEYLLRLEGALTAR